MRIKSRGHGTLRVGWMQGRKRAKLKRGCLVGMYDSGVTNGQRKFVLWVRFQLRLYWQTADSSGFLRTGTRITLIGKAGVRGGDSVDRAGHSMRGGLGDGAVGDGAVGDGGLGDDCAECGPRLRHLRQQAPYRFHASK